MTELSFAKSFLSALDGRPTKLSLDHATDPKTYPSRTPYTLPKTAHPLPKRSVHAPAPGSERALSVSLRSLRNPPLDLTLTSQPPTTSILDLKHAIVAQVGPDAGLAVQKIRLLHKKKPVADSKILKDLVSEDESSVEFSVMIIGGLSPAPTPAPETGRASPASVVAQGPSGAAVLETDEFWTDLKGFLVQRLRDEEQAGTVYDVFRGAWQANSDLS